MQRLGKDASHLLITQDWAPDGGFKSCSSMYTPKRAAYVVHTNFSRIGKARLYIYVAVFAVLLASSLGSPISISGIETAPGSPAKENVSPISLFHHLARVRRGVTEHHHNHHSRARQERHKKHHSAPVTRCPPPMARLLENACAVDPCQSDSECTVQGQSCCYNGCIYTCSHAVHPPPLIDWQTRQLTGDDAASDDASDPDEYTGNLEFDIFPGEMLAEAHRGAPIGELCSTTVEEGDIPLDCPHEYICHVEDKGDPAKGIPDRGRCVKIVEDIPEDLGFQDDAYLF